MWVRVYKCLHNKKVINSSLHCSTVLIGFFLSFVRSFIHFSSLPVMSLNSNTQMPLDDVYSGKGGLECWCCRNEKKNSTSFRSTHTVRARKKNSNTAYWYRWIDNAIPNPNDQLNYCCFVNHSQLFGPICAMVCNGFVSNFFLVWLRILWFAVYSQSSGFNSMFVLAFDFLFKFFFSYTRFLNVRITRATSRLHFACALYIYI